METSPIIWPIDLTITLVIIANSTMAGKMVILALYASSPLSKVIHVYVDRWPYVGKRYPAKILFVIGFDAAPAIRMLRVYVFKILVDFGLQIFLQKLPLAF